MTIGDRLGVDISNALDSIITKKSEASKTSMVLLGLLAGVYIAFGSVAATAVLASDGSKLAASAIFSVGLVLVLVPGSELFTGNILMATRIVDQKLPVHRVLRNWGCVYMGNFVGAVLIALAVFGGGLLGSDGETNAAGKVAVKIAHAKLDLTWLQGFLRGVLCNMLVCLAVILGVAARTVQGKVMGVFLPVTAFVVSGFEHSIANMYFLPAGLLAEGKFLSGFLGMFKNLIPVTAGNVVGGLLVILLHPARAKRLIKKAASVRNGSDDS